MKATILLYTFWLLMANQKVYPISILSVKIKYNFNFKFFHVTYLLLNKYFYFRNLSN